MSDLAKVRIQIGESSLFTRMEIDGVELRGITRLWFDSGDLNGQDGPRYAWRGRTRIHVEFYPDELLVEGEADVSKMEVRHAGV
jgi:hypothetical protein